VSARKEALRALAAIATRRMRIEEAIAQSRLAGRDRRLLHELVYGTLRHWWRLRPDWRRFVQKTPPVLAQCALALGLYQLRVMQTPAYAAVDETTEAVKALAPGLASFVHAVLRRAAEAAPRLASPLPPWVRRSWEQAYGKARLHAIEKAFVETPRIAVHLFVPRAPWLAAVRKLGVAAWAGDRDDLVWIAPPVDVQALPGYRKGHFVVLDLAAREAAEAAAGIQARLWLDACAAPGGKSAWLARLHPEARIVALEIDAGRIQRLRENLTRLRLAIPIVQADACRPPFRSASVEGVFLDAPCSASGIARRRPDVWFRHTRRDLARFAAQQRAMIEALLALLPPQGALIYAVCSLHPEETTQLLFPFRERVVSVRTIFPDAEHDGFFVAQLRR